MGRLHQNAAAGPLICAPAEPTPGTYPPARARRTMSSSSWQAGTILILIESAPPCLAPRFLFRTVLEAA